MKDWSQYKTASKPNSRTRNGPKISLKNVRPQTHGSQHTQSSTTCNSIYRNSDKKSIKDLMLLTKSRNFHNQPCYSMEYKDIRIIPAKQSHFLTNFFCAEKRQYDSEGCRCEPKCIWTNYWLSLSVRKFIPQNVFAVSKQTEEQIRKDIQRTQPSSPQFKKIYYQQALYQCLMSYARVDPEISYIQGMNMICSVLIYHGNSLDQCILIFKFLMIGCHFRDLLANNFKLAYELTNNLQQCLKYRCHDLYSHMIDKCEINLTPFTVCWLIPMMGDVIPLSHMHLVINAFIQKGFAGLIKIIMAMFLFLKNQILATNDETELMHMLSTHKLKKSEIDWEELIKSSSNIKNIPINC